LYAQVKSNFEVEVVKMLIKIFTYETKLPSAAALREQWAGDRAAFFIRKFFSDKFFSFSVS